MPCLVLLEPSVQDFHKRLVQLHNIEPVAVFQQWNNPLCHRPGAGPDLQHSDGVGASSGQKSSHRFGQKSAAGRNRAGGFKPLPKLAKERQIVAYCPKHLIPAVNESKMPAGFNMESTGHSQVRKGEVAPSAVTGTGS